MDKKVKSSIYSIVIAVLITSCDVNSNSNITCTIDNNLITLRNGTTTLSIDNDICFGITSGNNRITITGTSEGTSSVCLTDSADNIIPFRRNNVKVNEINEKSGKGKRIKIEALSDDRSVLCTITLTSYNSLPDVILVQSSFKNISERNYATKGYVLNRIDLRLPAGETEWWTFQGASYKWGQDFTFRLPDTFKRENYMGMNDVKAGGGIPLTDIWNRNWGVALACISDRPEDVSLPVEADGGRVEMKIKGKARDQVILPDDSLTTLLTAIILHKGDFYDPLRTYSGLMKPYLPQFQKPVDTGYQNEWCTWGYNQNFKPEQILDKTGRLQELGISSVIFDDGWSLNHGDWIPDPAKFPGGENDFKKLIDNLHAKGFKVWLWWVPGSADSKSAAAAEHPDWLIENRDGSVYPSYGFCSAWPPVQEYYKKLVRKFVEDYKIDGFKLDFREINSAPPCYNPAHHHSDPWESYHDTPLLFKNICETAKIYNPQMLIEYCSCGIPPNIFHLPWTNLAVTSDPEISQITARIKFYKALRGDDFPVLEEYCGVLAGPVYQLTIGAGGVPGTFSTYLDNYHEKWLKIYQKYQLSKGRYLNLYDIAFDYPEAHVIQKDGSYFYSFYTHPWEQSVSGRVYRFGREFDSAAEGVTETRFPEEPYSGSLEFRGLDPGKNYRIVDYENDRELGIIKSSRPDLQVSFVNYLLLEAIPVN